VGVEEPDEGAAAGVGLAGATDDVTGAAAGAGEGDEAAGEAGAVVALAPTAGVGEFEAAALDVADDC